MASRELKQTMSQDCVALHRRIGELLTQTGDLVQLWTDHFQELLGPTIMSFMEDDDLPFCLNEIAEIFKKLHRGKVPVFTKMYP